MEINLTAPINDLGYGVAGLNVLKGLVRNGCKVSYWPIGQATPRTQEDADIISQCMSNAQFFDSQAPSLRLWHQHDMSHHVGHGIRVGFPVFELDKFSELEKHHLQSLDKIIVCSEWAKSIVEKEVPGSSVDVAPLGVDISIFNAQEMPSRSTTVLLNIGKWEIRKGHDILWEAFNEAFNENDDVELWMMNHNPFLDEAQEAEWHNLYLQSNLGSKIKILPRVETHLEVAQVMRQADIGVFPSRAEGWNMELLESMAMNKPVIATNYSAHTEFCTKDNCFLIDINETEPAHDGKVFQGQGNWAKLGPKQLDMCIDYMRYVLAQRITTNEKLIT